MLTFCVLGISVLVLAVRAQFGSPYEAPIGSRFGIPTINRTFDYVVAGGGTAGLAVAYRLSQDPDVSVAVIEAGNFYEFTNGNYSQVPGYDTRWTSANPRDFNPLVDWGFLTTPQTGANGAVDHYARGKTLGGTSARNYLIYQRGTIGTHQWWADLVGDDSYTFENTLPYFERSLNFTPPVAGTRFDNVTLRYDASTLGEGGQPLDVVFPNFEPSFSTYGEAAFVERGMQPIQGFTSGELIGSSWYLDTLQPSTGLRESSETAFLAPMLGKTNLQIYPDTLALKVVFSGTTAAGVLVDSGGVQYLLSASKEVIVSAGAFQSPQLLMVSGVGDSATLSQFDIPVVADRPGVGQNMWDHVLVAPTFRINLETSSKLAADPNFRLRAIQEFNENGTGILSAPGSGFIGFSKVNPDVAADLPPSALSDLATFPDDWPDLEYIVSPSFSGNSRFASLAVPNDGYNYAAIFMALVAPLSRGNISISSADMHVSPLINPNWLTHPTDRAMALAAFKEGRRVFATDTMSNITIGPEYFPGANVTTDEQIMEVITNSFHTVYHAAATCAMGKADDPRAVVDSRARVIGTERLRVVDASALPFLPPGHPQATVYMLAEKIAEDMLNG